MWFDCSALLYVPCIDLHKYLHYKQLSTQGSVCSQPWPRSRSVTRNTYKLFHNNSFVNLTNCLVTRFPERLKVAQWSVRLKLGRSILRRVVGGAAARARSPRTPAHPSWCPSLWTRPAHRTTLAAVTEQRSRPHIFSKHVFHQFSIRTQLKVNRVGFCILVTLVYWQSSLITLANAYD